MPIHASITFSIDIIRKLVMSQEINAIYVAATGECKNFWSGFNDTTQ